MSHGVHPVRPLSLLHDTGFEEAVSVPPSILLRHNLPAPRLVVAQTGLSAVVPAVYVRSLRLLRMPTSAEVPVRPRHVLRRNVPRPRLARPRPRMHARARRAAGARREGGRRADPLADQMAHR